MSKADTEEQKAEHQTGGIRRVKTDGMSTKTNTQYKRYKVTVNNELILLVIRSPDEQSTADA